MTFQIFGSLSSVDVDLVVFVEDIPSMKASADLCYSYKNEIARQYFFQKPLNVNIACCKNGFITKVHKGTIDELNNSLWYTYDLHEQYFPQQIKGLLPRDVDLKMIRCSRKILSFLSRTSIRKEVKNALRGDFKEKVNLLSTIQLGDFSDFGKKGSLIDLKKMVAFQLGQTLALMEGKELYTKESIIDTFPSLAPFLKREQTDNLDQLQDLLEIFIQKSSEKLHKMTRLKEI